MSNKGKRSNNKVGGNCKNDACVLKNDKNDIISVRSSEIKPKTDKDLKCAPSKKFIDGSCIPLTILVKMANAYNDEFDNDKIKLSSTIETLNPSKYKKYLVKQFRKRLDNICDDQKCWVKQSFIKRLDGQIKDELLNNTFRPKGPQGQFTWLNTININQVFDQYMKAHNDFKFFGAVPIDFDDLDDYELKNLDFKKLFDNGIHKIGVIFNLDEHYKSGSHWVALYSDLKAGQVYFSDSYGIRPEKRITKFMRRIASFINDNITKNPVVDYNKTRHQYGNSECGLYSISFILRMLRGDSFEQITGKPIADEEINKCRKYYFS